MNTSFKVIGLTRRVIRPESTVIEADDFTSRLSELINGQNAMSFCVAIIFSISLVAICVAKSLENAHVL